MAPWTQPGQTAAGISGPAPCPGVEKDGSTARMYAPRRGSAAVLDTGRPPVTAWLLLGVGVLLIAGNAVFVASETALVTVERTEVEAAAAAGDARARRLQGALSRLSTQLSAAQLGITVTSLAVGLVAEPSIATLLHGP